MFFNFSRQGLIAIFIEYLKIMKKLIPFTLVAFVVTLALSSCKSHERCPAYGKVEQSQKKNL
jgi:hypothetical protein